MPSNAAKLRQRLSGYWKLEAGNVVLMPVFLAMLTSWSPSRITLFSFVPMMFLLVIGAYYWRAKLKQLETRRHAVGSAMRLISYSQVPALLLTLFAIGAVVYGWAVPGLFNSGADKAVATFTATLSVLEYVNYYHRQLQHFDHGPDFKRLLSGNGLRRSQMAKDLDTYRRT